MYIFSKFNTYNMNAHTCRHTHTYTHTTTHACMHECTHTHTHTCTHAHAAIYQSNWTEEKVFKQRKVFKEDLKELTRGF